MAKKLQHIILINKTAEISGISLFCGVVIVCGCCFTCTFFQLIACCIINVGNGSFRAAIIIVYRYFPGQVQVVVLYRGYLFIFIIDEIAVVIIIICCPVLICKVSITRFSSYSKATNNRNLILHVGWEHRQERGSAPYY
jgi:hypothetical protein